MGTGWVGSSKGEVSSIKTIFIIFVYQTYRHLPWSEKGVRFTKFPSKSASEPNRKNMNIHTLQIQMMFSYLSTSQAQKEK